MESNTSKDVLVMKDVIYKNVFGSLMHAMVCMRPNLVYLIFLNLWVFMGRNIECLGASML
jgi:hypothetical protein